MTNKITRDTVPLPLVRASILGTPIGCVNQEDFEEMKHHSVAALAAPVLSSAEMPTELYQQWKMQILSQISYNINCRYAELVLPITVPYVVLKGTSAARYYPKPELRTLGDIDIMTRPEDVDVACESLLRNGYTETTSAADEEKGRHRTFRKNGVLVEIHYSFAIMKDRDKAKRFDALITDHLDGSHVLPDLINGLVLIEHINQHLESGLGLRQIIDWMMFAERCLADDAEWTQFHRYAVETGMETLTIVTTRMCEIYLGLPEHSWSQRADESLCTQLMTHVLTSGNFGSKKTTEEKKAFYRSAEIGYPIEMLRELQRKGREEWKAAENPILRPFAWLWKGTRFIGDIPFMLRNHRAFRRHKKMLEDLGVVIRNLDGRNYPGTAGRREEGSE